MSDQRVWVRVERPAIAQGHVTTAIAGDRAVCLVHGEDGSWSALDNRCPHQGGPLRDEGSAAFAVGDISDRRAAVVRGTDVVELVDLELA